MHKIFETAAALGVAALLGSLPLSVSAQMTGNAPLTAKEKANVKIVEDFEREVLQAQNPAAASKYYTPDIIQHNPNVPTGLQGFQDYFSKLWKGGPKPVQATMTPAPDVLMVKGDLVLVMMKRARPDPADASKTYSAFWFDLFRVKDGKIAEHWDPAMKNPPST